MGINVTQSKGDPRRSRGLDDDTDILVSAAEQGFVAFTQQLRNHYVK